MSIIPLLDTGIESLTSIYNTNRSIKAQKQLAEYSYQKDLEMWNRSNEYNLPQNQMQRLKDANLNPSLVYGSGHVTGNTVQPTTPKYQMYDTTYRYKMPRVSDALTFLSVWQDYQIKKAQAEGARLDNVDKAVRNANNQDYYLGRSSKMYAEGINRTAENIGLPTRMDILTESKAKELERLNYEVDKILPARMAVYQGQVANMRENTLNKMMENKLFELGVTKSDNVGMRILLQGLQKQFPNLFKHYGL